MMSLQLVRRVFAALFFAALLAICCLTQTATSYAYEGIQIEFPTGGQLRIENELGDVAAEIWKEKYIYISTSEGGSSARGASAVIENRSQGFAIRVIRRPGVSTTGVASTAPINLTIQIPESSHVDIATGNGQVSMQGMPSSATIKSVAGDIKVGFLEPANADIAATSTNGQVRSELPQLPRENGHLLRKRLGTGGQSLTVNSGTGNISLSLTSDPHSLPVADRTNREPPNALRAEVNTKAAGTPAPA